jgi:serine/threonine protein kinase
MGDDELDVKTVIENTTLAGSGSPGELQIVAYVYMGESQYWVYAPGPAKGKAIDWLWQMIVRTPFSTEVTGANRVLVLKHVEEKLNELATPASASKPSKFKKPDFIIGAFNRYVVGDTIKKGNSGTVLSVLNDAGERFALKVLTQNAQGKPLVRFQNEINFCSVDRSPHIVRVVEYGRTEQGFMFYVMPYYPATLRDKIESGIAPNDVLPLFSQILDGVEAAHMLDVFHRDIKPENILYDSTKNILVVADFGISRFKRDDLVNLIETEPHEKLANFAYAAPEQRAIGKGKPDYRADIYSLGLVLNEMFTREVPQGTGFKRIGSVAPAFGYLDELVELMIRQNPDERPRSIRALKEELIGRQNEFVRFQQLDALKTKVIPESEPNDPLISDPIQAVEKLDYVGGVMTLRLNRAVNREWEACFRRCATSYSANISASLISFSGDKVMLRSDPYFLQKLIDYFKQYCGPTNEEYARQVKQGHDKQVAMAREFGR